MDKTHHSKPEELKESSSSQYYLLLEFKTKKVHLKFTNNDRRIQMQYESVSVLSTSQLGT